MKRLGLYFMLVCLLASCSDVQQLQQKDGFAVIPEAKVEESVATYAGGCFWAMQECLLELKGVNKVVSGYAGGQKENPTYAEVLSKNTGHAESVQVYYDPKVIGFKQLTTAFFHAHDPTQVDRQGPDVGSDYRSIAFFRSKEEFYTITSLIDQLDSSGVYKNKVATEVTPFKVIYGAEMEHQDYYRNNSWSPYIQSVSRPKVLKLRKDLPLLIKNEYLK